MKIGSSANVLQTGKTVLRAVINVLITMLFTTPPQSLQNLHITRYSLENTKPMFQHPVSLYLLSASINLGLQTAHVKYPSVPLFRDLLARVEGNQARTSAEP